MRPQRRASCRESCLLRPKRALVRGYTTNISVIEQQTYLVQAQTTEVVTKAAWLKAAGN
jgi:hypothetical protein